jgi:hypothetical protein
MELSRMSCGQQGLMMAHDRDRPSKHIARLIKEAEPRRRRGTVITGIDKAIKALPLQPRWESSIEQAIDFGRRTLQVACEDARTYKDYDPGRELAYWIRTTELARKAHEALDRLISHIGPGMTLLDILVPSARFPGKSGTIQIRIGYAPRSKDENEKELATLLEARRALVQLSAHAEKRRKGRAQVRKHEGNLEKRAFVYILAEGYIFLTGERPGKGRYLENNPFLRFVKAAADDAGKFKGKKDQDFFSALKSTLKTLDGYERSLAGTKNNQSISGIIAHGPGWA